MNKITKLQIINAIDLLQDAIALQENAIESEHELAIAEQHQAVIDTLNEQINCLRTTAEIFNLNIPNDC